MLNRPSGMDRICKWLRRAGTAPALFREVAASGLDVRAVSRNILHQVFVVQSRRRVCPRRFCFCSCCVYKAVEVFPQRRDRHKPDPPRGARRLDVDGLEGCDLGF
jgi:hypothetical protein